VIVKIAIAKPVIVVHTKGDKMPVYLDEVNAVEDFIKQKIKENADICIDTSHFATWVYAGHMGYVSKTYEAYGELLEETEKQFPLLGKDESLRLISEVLKDGEKEWVDAWMKHLQAVPSDDVLQGDVEYGYDPSYPDC